MVQTEHRWQLQKSPTKVITTIVSVVIYLNCFISQVPSNLTNVHETENKDFFEGWMKWFRLVSMLRNGTAGRGGGWQSKAIGEYSKNSYPLRNCIMPNLLSHLSRDQEPQGSIHPLTHRNDGHWVVGNCAIPNILFSHWFQQCPWDNRCKRLVDYVVVTNDIALLPHRLHFQNYGNGKEGRYGCDPCTQAKPLVTIILLKTRLHIVQHLRLGYISLHSQVTRTTGILLSVMELKCRVPQGSTLAPEYSRWTRAVWVNTAVGVPGSVQHMKHKLNEPFIWLFYDD